LDAGVAQTDQPRKFIDNLKRRFKKAGIELSSSWRQLSYQASNGKTYKRDHANAETLYQITQRMDVNTGIRDKVLRFLAGAGVVVDEMRVDPDKIIETAIAEYKRRGKSDQWIKARLISTTVRVFFTEAFTKAQRTKPSAIQYAIITDTLRFGLWKRNTKTIRKQLNITNAENVRDHLTLFGLMYEAIAEERSGVALKHEQQISF
jgi:hypothetical protein